jgi:hypothetical protein
MRIDFVSPEDEINPENDNVDVHLHLDDGRVYSFVVATPKNIYSCMDNDIHCGMVVEEADYFFSYPPPLLVRRLDRDCVERAMIALLDNPRLLEIYGVRQTTSEE